MITLIRGLPGSGKSTMARRMISTGEAEVHVEADMYFEGCRFDPSRLPDAHAWCLSEAKLAHDAGRHVVVSNTFTRRWEMAPYFEIAPDARVIEAKGQYQNIHGVPQWKVDSMARRWEAIQ